MEKLLKIYLKKQVQINKRLYMANHQFPVVYIVYKIFLVHILFFK